MEQRAFSSLKQRKQQSSSTPRIVRGADDQAAAYEAWLEAEPDLEDADLVWELVKQRLQETRRELGERLLFPK